MTLFLAGFFIGGTVGFGIMAIIAGIKNDVEQERAAGTVADCRRVSDTGEK